MKKYDEKMMNSAIEWSTYSYCKKKQVGAVLSKDGREIASGYNGTISGTPNTCEDYYYQCPHCKIKTKSNESYNDLFNTNKIYDMFDDTQFNYDIICKKCHKRVDSSHGSIPLIKNLEHSATKDSVIHAERNVIAYCAKHGIPTDGCTMYITYSPCQGCAVLMAQSGIKRVIYKEQYKDPHGIKILQDAKIKVEQYKE